VTGPSLQLDLFNAQHLFKNALSSNMAMIAGTALIAAYFYPVIGTPLLYWIASMCLISCMRMVITQQYFLDQKNNFSKRKVKSWLNVYIVSTFLFGSAAASLIFFMPNTIDSADISVMYIIFFAAMAGSITSLPVVFPAFIAFTGPLFIASFAYSFLAFSTFTIYISFASVIYYTFIVSAGRLLNTRYNQNFSLMSRNEDLISTLHNEIKQKQIAEQQIINHQQVLEETVEKRTKELADMNKMLINEINERRRIESNFKHLAHHDTLTNLPNRLLLDARLNHAIERARRESCKVAVLFIDLDNFKTINDSLGHEIGDKLLISISNRLLNCIREDDTVARLGGDEFMIIIEQVHEITDLTPLLEKIQSVTSQTVSINEHDISTSASIGISVFPEDGNNAELLMRNADAAMYYVKENGRRTHHFYTRELTTTAYDRVILETDLKKAIANNELLVYYQPQVSLTTKQIIGAEALVRWQHPDLGLLSPNQFLYIAEQTGLINDIGEKVLTTACRQIVKWKQCGLDIKTVAVNVAGNQIHHSDLVSIVHSILQSTKCQPAWLELEITEDFIIKKTKQSISTLQQLRNLGISLAIDDFGTGYSSLSYLKQLPINKLKIDRSFVKDISRDMEDAALVQAIIAMGKSMNLKLIAEGVENGSHEIFLAAHGCEYAQGFYYSKPIPAEELEALLTQKQDQLPETIEKSA